MLATFQAAKAMLWAGVRDNYIFVVGGGRDVFVGFLPWQFLFPRNFVVLLQLSISEALKSFEAFHTLAIVKHI